MQKVSDVIGRSVVSSEGGERIGRVSDVLLDPGSHRVVGLVLSGGVFKSEQVLRYADVQTLGRDAVIARGSEGVLDAEEWRRQGVEAFRSSTLTHKRVLTTGGRDLGEIDEVYLDDQSGAVEAFDVRDSTLGGLRHTRSRLTRGAGITIGADAVLVPEEIAAPEGDTSRQR
jgi:uncharacterized protein YrrD